MHKTYQFNERGEKPNSWGEDSESLLRRHVASDLTERWSDRRNIEEQIETMAEAVGKLCDLLVSKGVIKPEEFLKLLDLEHTYEVRNATN